MKRPITTLFLLISLDGKISTGANDALDFDKDFPNIAGVKEGLHQYYKIERTTDLWSINSGRVMAKVGANERSLPDKLDVSFVVIDNSHLTSKGVEYFSKLAKKFVLVTSNTTHPAYKTEADNINIIYQKTFNPAEVLNCLYEDYGCDRVTIQTGGTLNEIFLREKLLDYVDIVVAPILVGGKDTPSLIDGYSLLSQSEINKLGVLKLEECTALEGSYVRLRYKVVS
ncbi:MAG: dihydrofolate reductase family protein [Oscillospiraceae bacterium]|nr:dihydrofolate reductase family protein [Oscillospiraceae bacterium]